METIKIKNPISGKEFDLPVLEAKKLVESILALTTTGTQNSWSNLPTPDTATDRRFYIVCEDFMEKDKTSMLYVERLERQNLELNNKLKSIHESTK